jgi:type I restriction enzyme R subunit
MLTEAERITRNKRIDPRLIRAGWSIAPYRPNDTYATDAVEEFPTTNGPADYALCNEGRVHGVVEAKKVTLGPQGVLTQAERYSRGINQVPRYQGEFGVPFLYSTNGEAIWFSDVRNPLNRSRRVAEFHTSPALDEMMARDLDAEIAALSDIPRNPRMRPYQVDANEAIRQLLNASARCL